MQHLGMLTLTRGVSNGHPVPGVLMRGLFVCRLYKLNWQDSPPAIALSLIRKMQGVVPAYALPIATESHTRHYMPTRDKTAKVFDAFLRFESDDARLLVQFDIELTEDERSCLRELAEGMTYLVERKAGSR